MKSAEVSRQLRIRTTLVLLCGPVLCLIITWVLMYNRQHSIRVQARDNNVSTIAVQRNISRDTFPKLVVPAQPRPPRILHQTWKNYSLPIILRPWVQSCVSMHVQQRGWQYWFWTDRDALEFIQTKYPQYLDVYVGYPDSGSRADMLRYLVLYEYGGVYLDIDMECLRPMDDIIAQYPCIVAQEPYEHALWLGHVPYLSNAAMACHPKHKFFKKIIETLPEVKDRRLLARSGPTLMTELYFDEYDSKPVHVAASEIFNPSSDPRWRDNFQTACTDPSNETLADEDKLELCRKILKKGFSEAPKKYSITDHHWTHLYNEDTNDVFGLGYSERMFDIRKLITKNSKVKAGRQLQKSTLNKKRRRTKRQGNLKSL